MLLKDLTEEQRDKICEHFLNKYAPIGEDGMRHKMWKACQHCIFGDPEGGDCCAGIFDCDLPKELEEVIKDEV